MPAVTFDTYKFIKTLKEAGVPELQAEAFSTAVREPHEAAEVATREDLRGLELRIDARFEKVYGEMLLLKWMLGLLIAGMASLILKAFFGV